MFAGLLTLLGAGIGGQQALVDQLFNTELSGPVGLQQAGMHKPRGVFARLGMLNFVVKDGPQQHRVEGASPGLTADGGNEAFDLLEGVAPQRLPLIQACC